MPESGATRGFAGRQAPPRWRALTVGAATIAYPFAVYLGFGRVAPAWLAAGLAALGLLRAWSSRDALWLYAAGGAVLLALCSAAADSWLPVKLYPVLVSAVMLSLFGFSLLKPPTVIERIARLREPSLPAEALPYVRRVTIAWCGFFAVNGSLSLASALWASERVWLLYNGFLSYVLIAAFFSGEWLVRRRMRSNLLRSRCNA